MELCIVYQDDQGIDICIRFNSPESKPIGSLEDGSFYYPLSSTLKCCNSSSYCGRISTKSLDNALDGGLAKFEFISYLAFGGTSGFGLVFKMAQIW